MWFPLKRLDLLYLDCLVAPKNSKNLTTKNSKAVVSSKRVSENGITHFLSNRTYKDNIKQPKHKVSQEQKGQHLIFKTVEMEKLKMTGINLGYQNSMVGLSELNPKV